MLLGTEEQIKEAGRLEDAMFADVTVRGLVQKALDAEAEGFPISADNAWSRVNRAVRDYERRARRGR